MMRARALPHSVPLMLEGAPPRSHLPVLLWAWSGVSALGSGS